MASAQPRRRGRDAHGGGGAAKIPTVFWISSDTSSSDDMVMLFWGMFVQPSNTGRMMVVMNSRKTAGKSQGKD